MLSGSGRCEEKIGLELEFPGCARRSFEVWSDHFRWGGRFGKTGGWEWITEDLRGGRRCGVGEGEREREWGGVGV